MVIRGFQALKPTISRCPPHSLSSPHSYPSCMATGRLVALLQRLVAESAAARDFAAADDWQALDARLAEVHNVLRKVVARVALLEEPKPARSFVITHEKD